MSIMDRFAATHDDQGNPLPDDELPEVIEVDEIEQEPTNTHSILLTKDSKKRIPEQTLQSQIELLKGRVLTPGRIRQGWHLQVSAISMDVIDTGKVLTFQYRAPAGSKVYSVTFTLSNKSKASQAEQTARFRNIVNTLVASSNQRATGNWNVQEVDGQPWQDVEVQALRETGTSEFVSYTPMEIPQNWRDEFNGIYNRESQIELVMSCIFAAADSDFEKRFNALFAGPPANGKTEVGLALGRILGDSFLRFDGTAMTQAGIIKELSEREEMPRVIFVEEIEKGEEAGLRVMLGIMDTRGEIKKITAREKIDRDARCIVIATCNDYEKLEGMLAGALASRFGEPIWFPHVDRELMRKILQRECTNQGGNEAWIAPVLDYCSKREITDPRKAISFMLRGRDGWLDGTFPEHLEKVRKIGDRVLKRDAAS